MTDANAQPLAYSPKDAARVTGLGLTTIYRLINDGTLDRRKVGSRSLVTASSVRRLLGMEEPADPVATAIHGEVAKTVAFSPGLNLLAVRGSQS